MLDFVEFSLPLDTQIPAPQGFQVPNYDCAYFKGSGEDAFCFWALGSERFGT